MSFAENMVMQVLTRMSLEEKEHLIETIIETFFNQMPAAEKERLIEHIILKMLEGLDVRELLPRFATMLQQHAEAGAYRGN